MSAAIGLAVFSALLLGVVGGAWGAMEWIRRLRPGRESDLIAELGALRASAGLHQAALIMSHRMAEAAGDPTVGA